MIGGGIPARPISPATAAALVRFDLCGRDVALLPGEAGLQLLALWQGVDHPAPHILSNCFCNAETPAQLRAIADAVEALLVQAEVAS